MTVALADVVFAFDFERTFMSGATRYLYDYSTNGFHFAFPGGAADPTAQLDGSYSFDGGDYLAVPAAQVARFYAAAPTGAHTWLFRAGSTVVAAAQPRLFSCWNSTGGGVDLGIALALDSTATSQRVRAYQYQGAAAQPYIVSAAAEPYIHGYGSVGAVAVETTPRALHSQSIASYSWAVGAFGTASYSAALAPRIGMDPAATSPLTGRIGYLALVRGVMSSADLMYYSRLLAEGVTKPWAAR